MAHIQIIDDEPAVKKLFEKLLRDEGYSVATAGNGREGLHMMKEKKPDLAITDILMPEMDGLEVLREIHAEFPGLPVIVMSGGTRSGTVNFLPVAKQFGACCVLSKPVELTELLSAVQNALAQGREAATKV